MNQKFYFPISVRLIFVLNVTNIDNFRLDSASSSVSGQALGDNLDGNDGSGNEANNRSSAVHSTTTDGVKLPGNSDLNTSHPNLTASASGKHSSRSINSNDDRLDIF